jgi:hypothetical protein
MKTIILLVVSVVAVCTANGQSLKEALYSGRLKNDSNSTIRKGDTLKMRTDQEEAVRKVKEDSVLKAIAVAEVAMSKADSAAATSLSLTSDPASPYALSSTPPADPGKENTRIWKLFIDNKMAEITPDILKSGKLKNGTYAVLIEYEIGTDGYVTANSISSDPKSSFLEEQVKLRIMNDAPNLYPVLLNGKPRKQTKKQVLSFVKN